MGEGPVTLSWSEKVSRIVEVLQSELDEEVEAAVDFERIAERALVAIGDANV